MFGITQSLVQLMVDRSLTLLGDAVLLPAFPLWIPVLHKRLDPLGIILGRE